MWHQSPEEWEREEMKVFTLQTHQQVRLRWIFIFVVYLKLAADWSCDDKRRSRKLQMETIMRPPGAPAWCFCKAAHLFCDRLWSPNEPKWPKLFSLIPIKIKLKKGCSFVCCFLLLGFYESQMEVIWPGKASEAAQAHQQEVFWQNQQATDANGTPVSC